MNRLWFRSSSTNMVATADDDGVGEEGGNNNINQQQHDDDVDGVYRGTLKSNDGPSSSDWRRRSNSMSTMEFSSSDSYSSHSTSSSSSSTSTSMSSSSADGRRRSRRIRQDGDRTDRNTYDQQHEMEEEDLGDVDDDEDVSCDDDDEESSLGSRSTTTDDEENDVDDDDDDDDVEEKLETGKYELEEQRAAATSREYFDDDDDDDPELFYDDNDTPKQQREWYEDEGNFGSSSIPVALDDVELNMMEDNVYYNQTNDLGTVDPDLLEATNTTGGTMEVTELDLERDIHRLDAKIQAIRDELASTRQRFQQSQQRRARMIQNQQKECDSARRACLRLLQTSPTDTTSSSMSTTASWMMMRRSLSAPAFTVMYPSFREYADIILRIFQEPEEDEEEEEEEDESEEEEQVEEARDDVNDYYDPRGSFRRLSSLLQQTQPFRSNPPPPSRHRSYACTTRGARREARLLQTWHQEYVLTNHLKALAADCNHAVMTLYRCVLPEIREEQSIAEAVVLNNVYKVHAEIVRRENLYEKVMELQRKVIEKMSE